MGGQSDVNGSLEVPIDEIPENKTMTTIKPKRKQAKRRRSSDNSGKETGRVKAKKTKLTDDDSKTYSQSELIRFVVKQKNRANKVAPPDDELVKKKKRRRKPGVVALREIRKYQQSTDNLIRKRPFQRLVKSITNENTANGLKFKKTAMEMLQVESERFITDLMQRAQICAIACKRETIMPCDIRQIQTLRAMDGK